MTNVRRDVKEATATREAVFLELGEVNLTHLGYEFVGRGKEGLLFHNAENDLYVELKAVAKQPNFDGEDSVAQYNAAQEAEKARLDRKAQKELEKQERVLAKAKAKAEKEVAEKEESAEDEPAVGAEVESAEVAEVEDAEANEAEAPVDIEVPSDNEPV